jgi:DNA-binding MurR/RpiR family transcriptional regulator
LAENERTNYRPSRPTCLALLRAAYPQLPDAERRVADHVLARPDQVLLAPITRVAADAGVAVSTVTRLCTRLGLAGFAEMKVGLAVELFSAEPGDDLAPIAPADDAAAVVEKTIEASRRHLAATRAVLDPVALDAAARALARATRIEMFAQGPVTSAVAQIFQARLLLAGIPSAMHGHVGYQHLAAGLLGPGDIAVGLSQSGETEPVVRALATARAAGATTIAVTATPSSPLTREADACLLAAVPHVGPASHRPGGVIAMLAVLEALQSFALLVKYREDQEEKETQ